LLDGFNGIFRIKLEFDSEPLSGPEMDYPGFGFYGDQLRGAEVKTEMDFLSQAEYFFCFDIAAGSADIFDCSERALVDDHILVKGDTEAKT
jgi:hypothetical protein